MQKLAEQFHVLVDTLQAYHFLTLFPSFLLESAMDRFTADFKPVNTQMCDTSSQYMWKS